MTYKLTSKINEMFSTPNEIQNLIFKYGFVYLLTMILIYKFMQKKGFDNIKIAFVLIAVYLVINYLISDSLKIFLFRNIKQNAHIYLIALVAIYYFVFIKNGDKLSENFSTTDKKEMCKLKKLEQKKVKFLENEKCKLKDNNDNRDQINNANECYNFVGKDITVNRDTDSWCDLDTVDMDIINQITSELDNSNNFENDNILKDMNLDAYIGDDFATFNNI